MKKVICLLTVFSMLFGMVGCYENQPESSVVSTSSSVKSSDVLSLEEAVAITKDVLNRQKQVFNVMHFACNLPADESQYIPDEPDYWLITDERFHTMEELKAFVYTAYTPAYADTVYGHYLKTPEDPNEPTSFREYQGRLYANHRIGGVGNASTPLLDTLHIVSQKENTLVIAYDEWNDIAEEVSFLMVCYLQKVDGVWVLGKEEFVNVGYTLSTL